MTNPDIVGWIASAMLIATLSRQIYTQWKNPDPGAFTCVTDAHSPAHTSATESPSPG